MAAEGCLGISASAGTYSAYRSVYRRCAHICPLPRNFFYFFLFFWGCARLCTHSGERAAGSKRVEADFCLCSPKMRAGSIVGNGKSPAWVAAGARVACTRGNAAVCVCTAASLFARVSWRCACLGIHTALIFALTDVFLHACASHVQPPCIKFASFLYRGHGPVPAWFIFLANRACVRPRACAHTSGSRIYIFIYIYRLLYAAALLRLLGFGPL